MNVKEALIALSGLFDALYPAMTDEEQELAYEIEDTFAYELNINYGQEEK